MRRERRGPGGNALHSWSVSGASTSGPGVRSGYGGGGPAPRSNRASHTRSPKSQFFVSKSLFGIRFSARIGRSAVCAHFSVFSGSLFQKAPKQLLEKIPLEFRYEFRCGDVDCNGHTMMCTDWEMMQACRAWRGEYGEKWEEKFRQRFETEMLQKNDTHFFVGTLHQYPKSWIIVGLFYPPKPKMAELL
jgi:hypothetical protein